VCLHRGLAWQLLPTRGTAKGPPHLRWRDRTRTTPQHVLIICSARSRNLRGSYAIFPSNRSPPLYSDVHMWFESRIARLVGSGIVALGVFGCALGQSAASSQAQDGPPPYGATEPALGPTSLPPRPAYAQCPNLDSQLLALTAAADPEEFAGSTGLDFQDGMVRVIVELAGPTLPDANAYQMVVEGQSANLLQSRVPTQQLCPLANDPTVTRVRPPSRPYSGG
jgi:hypothetical protein